LKTGSRGTDLAEVMQLIVNSELETAKKKVTSMTTGVRTERMRGSLAAVNGIITSMTKKKEGSLPSSDEEKAIRAAHQILKSEMLDDFDKGYAETLVKYGKLTKTAKPQA
jgi:N-acetylglutamate synthase/N-acetylornithine aminotransferase